jgi:choline-glycine betaine transporter
VFFAENLAAVAGAVLGFLMGSFGWVFILSTFGFLMFVVYLASSRHGKIKLGANNDEPEFGTESVGGYFANLVPMSFRTAAFGDAAWLSSWTVFYRAWWISWAPFVGTFIARISRGRTIREFMLGVLVVPSLVTFVWFGVLGGSTLNLELTGNPGIVDAVSESSTVALFVTLGEFPLAGLMSLLAIVLVALFFIGGADAGAVVMGMLSSRCALEPNRAVVVIWGTLAGATAAICLLANGFEGLQQAAIISAAPFVLVMIAMCYSLIKELRAEPGTAPDRLTAPEPERAATRLPGVPAPQQMRSEPETRRQ